MPLNKDTMQNISPKNLKLNFLQSKYRSETQ